MSRPIILLLIGVLLSGCAMFTKGSDEVRFDRMQVAIARGDMLALFAVLQTRLPCLSP